MRQWLLFVLFFSLRLSAQWLETTIYLPDSLGGPNSPSRIFYNPNNNTVFIFGEDRAVLVLDGVTQRKIARLDLPGSPRGFCYNPQENKIYVAGSALAVIDAAANRVARVLSLSHFTEDVCYNPSLNRVYAVGENLVSVIDCRVDTVLNRVVLPSRAGNIACATRVNKVYCVMNNEDVAVIDCATDSVIKTFYTGRGPYGMLYNHLSNRLYIAEEYDEDVAVVDCEQDTVIRYLVAGYSPNLICLNTVNNKFYVADWDGDWFGIYDGAGDSLIRWLILRSEQRGLVFDSIDNLVYVALTGCDSIAVIDGVSDQLLRTIPAAGSSPMGPAYNPRANLIYSAEAGSNTVTYYDAPTSQVRGRVDVLRFTPGLITYISGNDRLYCADLGQRMVYPVECANNRIRPGFQLPFNPAAIIYSAGVSRAYVIPRNDSAIAVIDCARETVRTIIRLGRFPRSAVYALDMDEIYCAVHRLDDDYIAVLDCARDTITGEIITDENPVVLGYVPEHHLLYFTAGYDYRPLIIYDVANHRVVDEIGLGGAPEQVCYLRRENLLACIVQYSELLVLIDCATHRVQDVFFISQYPRRMVYNPVNNRLYCATYADTLFVIDPVEMAITDTILIRGWVVDMMLDSIASKLYLAFDHQDCVQIIDCQTNRIVGEVTVYGGPSRFAFSPPNRRMYVAAPLNGAVAVIRDSTVVGITEQQGATGRHKLIPTIVRNHLIIPLVYHSDAGFTLLDCTGRQVVNLKPGVNDLRNLAPGVYFLTEIRNQRRVTAQKVIITR